MTGSCCPHSVLLALGQTALVAADRAAVLPVAPSSPTSKPGLADHAPEAVEATCRLRETAEIAACAVIEHGDGRRLDGGRQGAVGGLVPPSDAGASAPHSGHAMLPEGPSG